MKSVLLNALPLEKLRELGTHLLKAGLPADKVVEELVAIADDLVDWSTILPAPWGTLLDQYDGPVLTKLIELVVHKLQAEIGK